MFKTIVECYSERIKILNAESIKPKVINETETNNILDLIKAVACILIIGSHCVPLFRTEIINFYYRQWLFRSCVPFFFITTGYYFYKMDQIKRVQYIKRIIYIYLLATVIYLPLYIQQTSLKGIAYYLVYGYHHLWYLSALIIGLFIVNIIIKRWNLNNKIILAMFCLLYIVGVFFSQYYKIFNNIYSFEIVAKIITLFGGTKHGIFFATPALLLGGYIANKDIDMRKFNKNLVMVMITFLLGFIEVFLLKNIVGDNIKMDLSFFAWLPAIPIFFLGIKTQISFPKGKSRQLRKKLDVVYVLHIWILFIVDYLFEVKYLSRFILTVVLCFGVTSIFLNIVNKIKLIKRKI